MSLFAQIWVSGLERGIECLGWIAEHSSKATPLPAHLEVGKRGEPDRYKTLEVDGMI